jgi:single-strand DNA-binding protein|tara:strand:- start:10235 stop:10651 length:417 start_codon:yes stop_codon:yes gene_type:complete
MSDINKVIVTGRVTRDSELRQTPNGTPVTDVSVVSNRIWTKNGERQEEATFVDVTIWGKQAETLSPMLTKGRHIMVEGRMKLNSWETDEGVKRSKLTIVSENINLTPTNPNPQGNRDNASSLQPVAASAASADDDAPF